MSTKLLVSLVGAILAASSPMIAATPEQAVRDAEKAWSSGIVSGDPKTLDRVLADDLIYNHSNGKTDTKETYVGSLQSGALKYLSVKYDDDPRVRIYNGAAVVFASAAIRSVTDGKENAVHLRFLHVYVKKAAGWQLVAHQSMRLPD